jgi:hypothetical protein
LNTKKKEVNMTFRTTLLASAVPLFCSLFIATPSAGGPSHYKGRVPTKPNKAFVVRGNIKAGKTISPRWANTSSMACWPATRNQHFSGKHVLYSANLPKRAEMTITLLPGKNSDLSLYAYSIGAAPKFKLPPSVASSVSCEASYLHKIKKFNVKTNPGGIEKVTLRALGNPYKIIIGVVGAHGAKKGSYKLRVALKGGEGSGSVDTRPPPIKKFTAKAGKIVTVKGRIDKGKTLPMKWAAKSSMACWPSTRNQHFSGKHVLYVTELPRRSIMDIELIPSNKNSDLSLYAYTTGMSGKLKLPPNVNRSVSCEASYLHGIKKFSVKTNPGGSEKVRLNAITNPYRVIIGVAGAHGAKAGSFMLKTTLRK